MFYPEYKYVCMYVCMYVCVHSFIRIVSKFHFQQSTWKKKKKLAIVPHVDTKHRDDTQPTETWATETATHKNPCVEVIANDDAHISSFGYQ